MWTYIRQIPDLKIFIMLFIVLGILGIYSFVKKNESTFYMIGYILTAFYCVFLIGIYFSPTVMLGSGGIDHPEPLRINHF